MMDSASSPDPQTTLLLAALAVLGRADLASLAALSGLELPAAARAMLASQPGVALEADGCFTLQAEPAAAALNRLEEQDLPAYRRLHEQGLHLLAGSLRGGQAGAEGAFMAALDRLVGRILLDDPPGLLPRVQAVQDVPLAEPAHRQLRLYFEGLGLGMQERYPQALAALDGLLAQAELERSVRGRALNSRAVFCRITGRLEEAIAGYRASLELWQELGNTHRQGLALLNLGIAAYQLQDYAQAEEALAQARRCFEQTGSAQWMAAVDNELGLVYRDQGRWSEALQALEAAAAQRRAEGAADILARALNNTGEVLFFMGRLEEAIAAFRQALESMTTRLYAVDVYLNLGMAYQVHGDLPGALAAFHQALELALQIERRDILAEAHFRLGEALRRQGQGEAALQQFRAAVEVIETTRQPLRSESLRISLQGRWQQVYEGLVLHLADLGQAAEAFEAAERARARAFAEALAGRGRESNPLALVPASAARVQAALLPGSRLLAYFTTGVRQRDLPFVRGLPPGSPLLKHLFNPARTLLFVLSGTAIRLVTCPIDPNVLIPDSLTQEPASPFLETSIRRRLYQALLEPAGELLGAQTLYILPHGPLHAIPFAALTGGDGRPLAHPDGPRLVYIPSATAWLEGAGRSHPALPAPGTGAMLALGYDGAAVPNEGVGRGRGLRHTEAEARLLAGLLGGEAWVGPQAKRSALPQAAAGRRWLHFACHASFDYEDPLASYLEIAAGERLAAREVLASWRLSAELVALSACQTGVSRILRGDEPMGLARAFLSAGAGSVLVSLWPVEDLPTFLLMGHFYARLQAGLDPPAALLRAQVWLREARLVEIRERLAGVPQAAELAGRAPQDQPFSAPRHWAAFILVGLAEY